MKADVGTPVVKSGLGEFLRLPPFGRKLGGAAEYVVIPVLALLASLVLFGILSTALVGVNKLSNYIGDRAAAAQTGFYILLAGAIVVVLLLLFVRLWFDIAQVRART